MKHSSIEVIALMYAVKTNKHKKQEINNFETFDLRQAASQSAYCFCYNCVNWFDTLNKGIITKYKVLNYFYLSWNEEK